MICVSKNNRQCNAEISLPASKSISNRLLILQFFYGKSLNIRNISNSDDTLLLASLLDLIRQYKMRDESGLLRIDAKNSGSVIRFLVPLLSITPGHFLLTGNERMKARPIGALVEAMRDAGAGIDYVEKIGFPPLLIRGRNLSIRRIRLDSSLSSQFVTACLLLAPTLEQGLIIELTGKPVSWPYVQMTTGILMNLGVPVIVQENTIHVYAVKKLSAETEVESDWSSASFWYCLLSMAEKGEIFFPGLKKSGLQGDQQLAAFFTQLGVESVEEEDGIRIRKQDMKNHSFFADFTSHPDLALPIILASAAAGAEATFTGLELLRIKESDRLEAITNELRKTGIFLHEDLTGIWRMSGHLIEPGKLYPEHYNDHRVAMTLACLAMKGFSVHLEQPEVVNKSYPGFWKDLESAGFKLKSPC